MAGQIELLKNEIDNDPIDRGYAAMTDIQVADSINTVDLSKNKATLTNSEILEAISPVALMSLTGDKAQRVWGVLAIPNIDPFGVAVQIFVDAFGAGSTTITNLAALRVEGISRANKLGYPGRVKEGHVQMARAK